MTSSTHFLSVCRAETELKNATSCATLVLCVQATSEIDLLAATLLLCLSNLLFLPAVGLAVYRGFYTESFVYFATMVFSTLFHACDQVRLVTSTNPSYYSHF